CGCGVVATVLRLAMCTKLSQQTQTVCMCCMWMENSWLMPMATMSTCIRLLTLNSSACKKHRKDRHGKIDAGLNIPKPCLIPLVQKKGNEYKPGAEWKLLQSLSIEANRARYNFSLKFHFLTKKARQRSGKSMRPIRPNSK